MNIVFADAFSWLIFNSFFIVIQRMHALQSWLNDDIRLINSW